MKLNLRLIIIGIVTTLIGVAQLHEHGDLESSGLPNGGSIFHDCKYIHGKNLIDLFIH